MSVRPLLRPIIRMHRAPVCTAAVFVRRSVVVGPSERESDRVWVKVAWRSFQCHRRRRVLPSVTRTLPPAGSSVGHSRRYEIIPLLLPPVFITPTDDWLSRHNMQIVRHTIFSIILSHDILFCMSVRSITQICWRNHHVRRFYKAVLRNL